MPEFVNPEQILNQLGLQANITAADFGCGSGGWTIPLAQQLEDGRVFAIDIQEEPLSALASEARRRGLTNIVKITADAEAKIPGLEDSSCNLVLITNLFFQVKNKQAVFAQAKRVLKPGGKILVVEWNVDSPLGPLEGRVSQETLKDIAKNLGLSLEKEFRAGDYHYGLVFTKL